MKTLMRRAAAALLLCGVFAAPLQAAADTYPVKPVKLVVPFPPGGTADALGRMLAREMEARLKQPIVVENRGGAGTIVGTQVVAHAPPDGYTLLLTTGALALQPSLFAKLPYDVHKDLTPLADVASFPAVLAVPAQSPDRTLAQLVQRGKSAGHLSYGTSAAGGPGHFASEMFGNQSGTKLIHVPYKGSAPVVVALMGGQIDFAFDVPLLLSPLVQSGKLRALAQTGSTRSPLFPDVPTMVEAGFPDFVVKSWYKLLVTGGTPAPVVERLSAVAQEVLAQPKAKEFITRQGLELMGEGYQGSKRHLDTEIERWAEIVRTTGVKLE